MAERPPHLLHVVAEAVKRLMEANILLAEKLNAALDEVRLVKERQDVLKEQQDVLIMGQEQLTAEQRRLTVESEALPVVVVDELAELGERLTRALSGSQRETPRAEVVEVTDREQDEDRDGSVH